MVWGLVSIIPSRAFGIGRGMMVDGTKEEISNEAEATKTKPTSSVLSICTKSWLSKQFAVSPGGKMVGRGKGISANPTGASGGKDSFTEVDADIDSSDPSLLI